MKKTIAWMLVLVMVFGLLAGCGNGTSDDTVSSTASAASESSAVQAEQTEPAAIPGASEPAASSEEAALSAVEAEPAYEKVEYTLPLFEEPYEFSFWWVLLGGANLNIAKSDTNFWQHVSEELNVDITWKQVSEQGAPEQYNLMIASGDYTDLIYHSNSAVMGSSTVYTNGYDAAISDDVYLALNDLIPEYAPNYYSYLMGNEELRKQVTTDAGNWYAVHMLYDKPQGPRECLFVTDASLEAGNITEIPETVEGWLEAYAAMKSGGVTYPAGVNSSCDVRGGAFMSAFGTSGGSAFQIDAATDSMYFDATSENFRDYIEYMRTLWQNGYISPDFTSISMFDNSYILEGAWGTFGGMWYSKSNYAANYGTAVSGCPVPYLEDSEYQQTKMVNYDYFYSLVNNSKEVAITTACEEPEKALMFLDWFYSDAGIQAGNYGFEEGVSYEIVDGKPQLTEMMLGTTDAGINCILYYAMDDGPMVQYVEREYPIREADDVATKETWSSVDLDRLEVKALPGITLSEEESTEVSSTYSDISTYVESQKLKWMTCEEDLTDESWNAYCQTIESMGIKKVQEAYENAYARYNERA